ncbi:IQ domain-containing protein K-like [Ptychodera flava]|uniref:IQ domain-containing protein K-like n=1 Tax=Ptychodera flava TaxID=63121 RepID=UPI00396A4C11
MSVVIDKKEPKLWDEICKEFALQRPPFQLEDDAASVVTDIIQYDPAAHTPVIYGKMMRKIDTDCDPVDDFDPALSHPALVGHTILEKPPKSPPPTPPPPPPKDTCSPREYLEYYVFPVLLPGMLEMLKQAKDEKCFERKRFRFNGLDFLTEYLWRHNTDYFGRENDTLDEIPFVQKILAENPRPPLPLSLIWTEEEAAIVIQSFYRGYRIRRDPEVQELRQWQKELREENEDISVKVENFWRQHEPPDSDEEVAAAAAGAQGGRRSVEFRRKTSTPRTPLSRSSSQAKTVQSPVP